MKEVILDTLLDSLKLLPFLFLTFLFIEYVEHKVNNKKIISTSGRFGPLIGSILGAFPQCGFGVSATNLFSTRIITLGTLISVYLSTSDEMLPILISEKASISLIISIILIKVIIGMTVGFLIDLIIRKKEDVDIHSLCADEHCHCEDGILKSSIKHTISILLFIMIISFLLNLLFEYLGEESIEKLFLKNSIFAPFISSIVGLIPNCGASVVITELYLKDVITFGSLVGGLLTGSGVGLLVLFKTNKNLKQNLAILFTIYLIGVVSGIIINLF